MIHDRDFLSLTESEQDRVRRITQERKLPQVKHALARLGAHTRWDIVQLLNGTLQSTLVKESIKCRVRSQVTELRR